MKNAILCWTRLKITKHVTTIKQIIRKKFTFCLKNHAFSSQSKRRDMFDYSRPLFIFVGFLRNPLPPSRQTYFLNASFQNVLGIFTICWSLHHWWSLICVCLWSGILFRGIILIRKLKHFLWFRLGVDYRAAKNT